MEGSRRLAACFKESSNANLTPATVTRETQCSLPSKVSTRSWDERLRIPPYSIQLRPRKAHDTDSKSNLLPLSPLPEGLLNLVASMGAMSSGMHDEKGTRNIVY